MIVQAQYREHISHSVERAASRELQEELAGDFDAGDFEADDFDGDAAEIRRMIELSGMIGLECTTARRRLEIAPRPETALSAQSGIAVQRTAH